MHGDSDRGTKAAAARRNSSRARIGPVQSAEPERTPRERPRHEPGRPIRHRTRGRGRTGRRPRAPYHPQHLLGPTNTNTSHRHNTHPTDRAPKPEPPARRKATPRGAPARRFLGRPRPPRPKDRFGESAFPRLARKKQNKKQKNHIGNTRSRRPRETKRITTKTKRTPRSPSISCICVRAPPLCSSGRATPPRLSRAP